MQINVFFSCNKKVKYKNVLQMTFETVSEKQHIDELKVQIPILKICTKSKKDNH